jgi:hypothetical protein
MMRFLKPLAATLALTIGATTVVSTAEARHRYRHYGHHHGHHHHGDFAGAAAAGIFGLAAGALVGSALSRPYYGYYGPAPVYRAPPPVVYEPSTAYYGAPEAWSPEWYSYCTQRYRSFNPDTGYFLGYDGNYHFCN